jgi:hypothetical protein
MRVWNGKHIKVLQDRGWIRVFIPVRVMSTRDSLKLMNWLKTEDYGGRYYPAGILLGNGEAGFEYYFEDRVAAQMFVLRWA